MCTTRSFPRCHKRDDAQREPDDEATTKNPQRCLSIWPRSNERTKELLTSFAKPTLTSSNAFDPGLADVLKGQPMEIAHLQRPNPGKNHKWKSGRALGDISVLFVRSREKMERGQRRKLLLLQAIRSASLISLSGFAAAPGEVLSC